MIQIRDLTFSYSGSPEPAVQALSFEVGPGEIFGFLGPSGAGKSTTQKILIGILQGYGGAASIFGKDLAGRDSDYYERIGVGIVAASAIYTLSGFLAVARYDSINEYIFPSMLWATFFSIPFLPYFDVWTGWLFYLHPLQAPLVLLEAAFSSIEPWVIGSCCSVSSPTTGRRRSFGCWKQENPDSGSSFWWDGRIRACSSGYCSNGSVES